MASIKPTTPGNDNSTSDLLPGGHFRVTNKTVVWLARIAFGVSDSEISGGPAWIRTEGYDIDAKADSADPMTPEQLKPLLLNLLTDRFRMKFRQDTRQLPVYALVATKNGPQLKPHAGSLGMSMNNSLTAGKVTLTAVGISMTDLAGFLGRQVGRPVINESELTGNFDLTLQWSPDAAAETSAPSIYTAIQEQLGLKLVSQKGPVQTIIIESAQRPSAN